MSIDSIFLEEDWTQAFQVDLGLSNTWKEADVMLESCLLCEKIFTRRPREGQTNTFTFISGVIEDFGVGIPFTLLQSEILNIVNVASSKQHYNS